MHLCAIRYGLSDGHFNCRFTRLSGWAWWVARQSPLQVLCTVLSALILRLVPKHMQFLWPSKTGDTKEWAHAAPESMVLEEKRRIWHAYLHPGGFVAPWSQGMWITGTCRNPIPSQSSCLFVDLCRSNGPGNSACSILMSLLPEDACDSINQQKNVHSFQKKEKCTCTLWCLSKF